VDEAVDHDADNRVVGEDPWPIRGLLDVTMRLARS
jgi:hypothetical protein